MIQVWDGDGVARGEAVWEQAPVVTITCWRLNRYQPTRWSLEGGNEAETERLRWALEPHVGKRVRLVVRERRYIDEREIDVCAETMRGRLSIVSRIAYMTSIELTE